MAARDQAVRRWIVAPGVILTAAVVGASACAAAAGSSWLTDLAVHFHAQYAALGLLAFVVFAALGRPAWAAVALIIAVLNAMIAAPMLVSHPRHGDPAPSGGTDVRLAFVNVLYRSHQYDEVVRFVRASRADAVVFAEVSATWRSRLAALRREYPYEYHTQGSRARGLTLLSKVPISRPQVVPLSDDREPAFRTVLELRGKPLQLLGVHASWPFGPHNSHARNRQLEELGVIARAMPKPLVLLGDLNVSPYSPHFQGLLRHSGLSSAALGFGWQPTWPVFAPPAGIQIDHALVSEGVEVTNFFRGPAVGSDHRPIVVDLRL